MLPTLRPGQVVVGFPAVKSLKPGQLIVFERQGIEQIKRVSMVEGDEVYVLGDNPGRSTDSRTIGWVPRRSVRARIIYPSAATKRVGRIP